MEYSENEGENPDLLNHEDQNSDQIDNLESELDKLLEKDKELEKVQPEKLIKPQSVGLNSTSGKLSDLTDLVNASLVPPTIDNTLSYNAGCIKVLRQVQKQLKSLLQENQKKQRELVEYITLKKKGGDDDDDSSSNLKIKCVGIPYFKDKDGFLPPHNNDVRKKLANKELLPEDYIAAVGTWNKKEHETLENGVIEFVRNSRAQKLKLKRDDLLKQNPNNTKEIESLDIEIEDIKNKPGALLNIFPNEVDWLMISSQIMMGKYSDCECEAKWSLELDPQLNKSKWKSDELEKLDTLAKKHNYQDWDLIARNLNTNRSGYNCCVQYHLRNKAQDGKWATEEDEKLKELVQKYKFKDYVPWMKIAWHFDSRSARQCRERYDWISDNVKKGRFDPEEDFKLVVKLKECESNFLKVAETFPDRSVRQIRSRYDYLIGKNMVPFSEEEEKLLIELVHKHPKKWRMISGNFQNRTALQCRKAWQKLSLKVKPDKSNEESDYEDLSEDFNYRLLPTDEVNVPQEKVKRNIRRSIEAPGKPTDNECIDLVKENYNPYKALLKYLKTGHEFSYGPRPRILKNPEEIYKSAATTNMIMSMLGVSCDFSSKLETVQSIDNNEFYEEDRIILKRLCEKEDANAHLVYNNLIPPNYNTLVGLRSLILWKNDPMDSDEDDTSENMPASNSIPQDDRLLFTDAKLLFKNRIKTLFALPIICSLTNPESIPDVVVKHRLKKKGALSKKKTKERCKKMVQGKQSVQKSPSINDGHNCEMNSEVNVISEENNVPTYSGFSHAENIPVSISRKRPGRPKKEVTISSTAKIPRMQTRRSILAMASEKEE